MAKLHFLAAVEAASNLVAMDPGEMEGPTKPSTRRLLLPWLVLSAVATAVTDMRTAITCSATLASLNTMLLLLLWVGVRAIE